MRKLLLIPFLAAVLLSCQKNIPENSFVSLPTVITDSVTAITFSTATAISSVTDNGGDSVIARGVCWDTAAAPTIAGHHTINGGGIGNFASAITGLNSATVYYVRAYATNSVGTAYGNTDVINSLGDIYVVGGQYGLGGANTKATLWKNGVATLLTNGTTDACAFSGCRQRRVCCGL
jgi:hypothetical protein